MIHKISSSLPSFKSLEFTQGLNVLIAQKETDSTSKQTRNRAGKTSLIEIIHFLTGANANMKSLFRSDALINHSFTAELDIGGNRLNLERTGKQHSKVNVGDIEFTNSGWVDVLGKEYFHLDQLPDYNGYCPTFRSLFNYFVRRQLSHAFQTPEKQAEKQQTGNWQVALLYLLGLDWKISSDWQQVRDREKTLKELKKAAKSGALANIVGNAADLRTKLTIAESRLQQLSSQIESFRVLPQYREMEIEADELTQHINKLANDNVLDTGAINDLEAALNDEAPPPIDDLEKVYKEAGIVLPEVVLKRYEDVKSFHESVVRNRKSYLKEELEATKLRIQDREKEKEKLDSRRSEIMRLLRSHGALDQFMKLQAEASKMESEVKVLKQKFENAEQLESNKTELELERGRLTLRLRRDFSEQEQTLKKLILTYENISNALYESAGSMALQDTTNGPEFDFPMQGSSSKGIKNMQIFCFDMMLMSVCVQRGFGPGFLVHDSHLFDGVDGRQVISALKLGSEMAESLSFQYIVTMNEDDAFKESINGFNLKDYVIPVVLTDATEDGGLFGIRF